MLFAKHCASVAKAPSFELLRVAEIYTKRAPVRVARGPLSWAPGFIGPGDIVLACAHIQLPLRLWCPLDIGQPGGGQLRWGA